MVMLRPEYLLLVPILPLLALVPWGRGAPLARPLLAGAAGLVVGLARRRFDVAAIAAILLVETLVQAVFIASPRRTLTLLPLIAALAGAGVIWLWAQSRNVARRSSQNRSP
jgi:hypothetical protein